MFRHSGFYVRTDRGIDGPADLAGVRVGVLVNDGSGNFSFRALPELAQISPAFGSAVGDFDADGNPDIYLVQNFFRAQLETRPMDGGLSVLLRGDGHVRAALTAPSADCAMVHHSSAISLKASSRPVPFEAGLELLASK